MLLLLIFKVNVNTMLVLSLDLGSLILLLLPEDFFLLDLGGLSLLLLPEDFFLLDSGGFLLLLQLPIEFFLLHDSGFLQLLLPEDVFNIFVLHVILHILIETTHP
jgi:hypothetical protein